MRTKANIQLLSPEQVRHRRLQLGLTESYLGSLCGVSSSVIRRLESGWPQDDLSARFITLLAEQLGTHVSHLLADTRTHAASAAPDTSEPDDIDDIDETARRIGAALLGADEPIPTDALCQILAIDLQQLDDAIAHLNRTLEPAGGLVVDNGAALSIADDLADLDRPTLDRLARATFARRRPNLPELRAIHQLLDGTVIRREDLDTTTGRTLARLRKIGVLANAERPAGVKSDPPKLTDDVTYSLILDPADARGR